MITRVMCSGVREIKLIEMQDDYVRVSVGNYDALVPAELMDSYLDLEELQPLLAP